MGPVGRRACCVVAFACARICAALLLASCAARPAADHAPLKVITTFSTLGALVRAVGGDAVSVSDLVPVGASPEDYQPTPADIRRLHDADVVFENGGGIDSWLQRTVADARNGHMRVVVLSDRLPLRDGNPHVWMDPVMGQRYVATIATVLSNADPPNRRTYARNARSMHAKLDALRHDIARRIASVPPGSRTMIVFHNAWQYYNDRFGIRTLGVIELSPGQEPSPQYIANLVHLARQHHVRAIFAEPEYSPKLVQALAQSAGIQTVENLYDDSLSTTPAARDYPSMLRYDTETIVRALR